MPGDTKAGEDDRIPDLLCVSADAVPIVVETKLISNRDAKKTVLLQALDYATRFASLDIPQFDQLMDKIDGPLSAYATTATQDALEKEFFRLHFLRSFRANLRGGKVRVVIAVDQASPTLLKMFKFVRTVGMELRLLEIGEHKDSSQQTYIIARQASVVETSKADSERVISALVNKFEMPSYQCTVRPEYALYWPTSIRRDDLHYEFQVYPSGWVGVEVHLESREFADQQLILQRLAMDESFRLDFRHGIVRYDERWSNGGGRLAVLYPCEMEDFILLAMKKLMERTEADLFSGAAFQNCR